MKKTAVEIRAMLERQLQWSTTAPTAFFLNWEDRATYLKRYGIDTYSGIRIYGVGAQPAELVA